jgi:hypothetical protein
MLVEKAWLTAQCWLDQMVEQTSKSLGKRVNSLEINNRGGAFWKFFENAG